MRIKKFNEAGDFGGPNKNPHYKPMKKFVLTTTSESSDHYMKNIKSFESFFDYLGNDDREIMLYNSIRIIFTLF